MSSSPFFSQTPPPDESLLVKQEQHIVRILRIYEEKFSIFDPKDTSSGEILRTIDKLLHPVLNINIRTLFQHDISSFKMIVAAFFGRRFSLVYSEHTEQGNTEQTGEEDLLSECHHPLHTLIVMCYAAHSMQKIILKNDFGQDVKSDTYKKLKDRVEGEACDLINHLYSNNPNQAKVALEADYQSKFARADSVPESKYREYLKKKFDQSKEIMAVAYEAKAMKFLSQRPCLNLMRIRKECRKRNSDGCKRHSMRRPMLYAAPPPNKGIIVPMITKLVIHMIMRGVYVVMFAILLCRYPNYDDYDQKPLIELIPFFYVLSVLVAQISMTFVKLVDYLKFHSNYGIQPKTKQKLRGLKRRIDYFRLQLRSLFRLVNQYFHENSLSFFRMVMIMALIGIEVIRLLCFLQKRTKGSKNEEFWRSYWTFVPISLELLYCTLFAIAAISSLRLFHSISKLGFFVHLMKKMLKTVGMFVLIFSTFWLVLAVIHVSISRSFPDPQETMLYTVISEGKFEIFGEVRDEDRKGELVDCGRFNRTFLDLSDMNYAEASCLFRTSVIPFIVFVYMFVAGVLLVNLLTAQLTKEYEQESENSRFYFAYLEYEQLSKIESKLFSPPPFSLLYVLTRVLFFFCDCDVVFRIVVLIEGDPWGVVREGDAGQGSQETEEAVRKFMNKDQSTWDQLQEIVNNFSREETRDNIAMFQEEIVHFLGERLRRLDERAQTQPRSRGVSVLETNRPHVSSTISDDAAEETSIPLSP